MTWCVLTDLCYNISDWMNKVSLVESYKKHERDGQVVQAISKL